VGSDKGFKFLTGFWGFYKTGLIISRVLTGSYTTEVSSGSSTYFFAFFFLSFFFSGTLNSVQYSGKVKSREIVPKIAS